MTDTVKKAGGRTKWFALAGIAVAGFAIFQWVSGQQGALPEGIASGNGRIEAEQVDIAAKSPARVQEMLVDEGDLVSPGDVIAQLDTAQLMAELARAEAEQARAQEQIIEGRAQLTQAQSRLTLAEQEYNRSVPLAQSGSLPRRTLDQRLSERDNARAAVEAAQAYLNTLDKSVLAAAAQVDVIRTQIDDSTLRSPVFGRVLYQLAETGEVVSSGGVVATVIDLSEVYMEIYLPSQEAARLAIGSEARIKLDIFDEITAPAQVVFVAPEAQFTPKQVETRDERDKLMFRVKVRVPTDLIRERIAVVKTGVRGTAYVMTAPDATWPDWLAVNMPDDLPGLEDMNAPLTTSAVSASGE